jgi:hypothetical protein
VERDPGVARAVRHHHHGQGRAHSGGLPRRASGPTAEQRHRGNLHMLHGCSGADARMAQRYDLIEQADWEGLGKGSNEDGDQTFGMLTESVLPAAE